MFVLINRFLLEPSVQKFISEFDTCNNYLTYLSSIAINTTDTLKGECKVGEQADRKASRKLCNSY